MIRRAVGVLTALTVLPLLAAPGAFGHAADPGTDDPSSGRSATAAGATPRSEKDRKDQASRAKVEEEDPLAISMGSITPSVLPRTGPLQLTGTVTNRSEETWSVINVYATVSDAPITTARDLELNAQTDPALPTSTRIVENDPETFELIDRLEPGESAPYSVTIPHRLLMRYLQQPVAPGVYWLGVQALGETAEGRDPEHLADGRARAFIPYLTRNPDLARVAMVVPIRHEVVYTRSGRLKSLRVWNRDLAPGGRLRNLLDFASPAPAGAVTWLIDPAVLEAVRRIAAGNPGRDLGPVSDGGQPSETPSPTASDAASTGAQEKTTTGQANSVRWAEEWLARVEDLTRNQQVLGLPYGDVDMAAATGLDPALAVRAQAMSASTFDDFDLGAVATVAPPSGYLSAASVTALEQGVTVLATNAALADPPANPEKVPTTVIVGGHPVDLFDAAASSGGPGPNNPLAPLALRQRLLSEAALRSLNGSTQPVVVSLPVDWDPGTGQTAFFSGLDQPWLSLVPQPSISQFDPPRVPSEGFSYPERQQARELDGANFVAADRLTAAGGTLQNVLTQNNTVEREVTAQALTTTSYFARADPTQAAVDAEQARGSIERTFRQIHISAPPYVTLSSGSGRFRIDLSNDLDEAVTLRIKAVVDEDLEIRAPKVALEGNSSTSVLLHVRSTRLGVHQVKLVVTDSDGTALGPAADFPIRSSQTGRIIWVIIAVGAALLFGAIAVRLYRRFVRRGSPKDDQ